MTAFATHGDACQLASLVLPTRHMKLDSVVVAQVYGVWVLSYSYHGSARIELRYTQTFVDGDASVVMATWVANRSSQSIGDFLAQPSAFPVPFQLDQSLYANIYMEVMREDIKIGNHSRGNPPKRSTCTNVHMRSKHNRRVGINLKLGALQHYLQVDYTPALFIIR